MSRCVVVVLRTCLEIRVPLALPVLSAQGGRHWQSQWHPTTFATVISKHVLRVAVLGLVGLIAAAGCGRDTASSPASPPPPETPVERDVSAVSIQRDVEADAASTESPPSSADASERDTPEAAEPETDAEPAGEAASRERAPRERIALLTPGGPLLLDVWLSIEGQPLAEVFAARVKQVLDAGDADADDRSTWKELAANEEFLQAEGALNPASERRRAEMWTERFDTNRDKQIQPAEAASWLGRNAGRSVAALNLRSRRSYHAIPAVTSRVWQLLDADRNGQLSSDEIVAAPEKLLSLDANDDRMITPPELAPLRDQLRDPGVQLVDVGRAASRRAAIHLEPDVNVRRLDFLLSDLYAPRQDLGPRSFPELARLFEELDANGDERLERQELAGLLTVEPHLALSIAFEQPEPRSQARVSLEIRDHASEVTVLAQPSVSRIVVSLGSTRIIVSAHDLAMLQPGGQGVERSQVRMMVHDECDALFEELDRNADGRLGEREITSCPAQMLVRDADGDGQLSSDELPYSMIVAFLRSERLAEQSFYLPDAIAAPSYDARTPSWFVHADFNGDGDVSRREFLGSIEQFSSLDANRDGYIAADEAAAFQTE